MFIADHKYESPFRVSSSNFILGGGGGGKLTDHVAIRPRRGEGRLHIYNIGNVLGGRGEFGSVWERGELSCSGGKFALGPHP